VTKIRLGVDVGGTFTDVVAIDASTRALLARVKVPTTHDAPAGVAAGIVTGIARILDENGIVPEAVTFIAHSTTQATNALLEGDVAKVGVLGLTHTPAWFARAHMRFAPVRLAPGVDFSPSFVFARGTDEKAIERAIERLVESGVTAIAASEPFGVDRPAYERAVTDSVRALGIAATSGHDVSTMYGLRARTRTAALNAAILPKMLETAQSTAASVARSGIAAPLMIMRSDGGVMNVGEVERRPILTLLSGPAAGVAGALLYENVTDGVFLEVGGTSVDCSAIRFGRPQMRAARVGGLRTMLQTIDSRTLGIAGGSMPRIGAHAITDVGPRSAHIAGLRYASFLRRLDFEGARIERFAPRPHDPANYLRFALRDGGHAAVTPTCASNLLGYVPEGAFARGDAQAALAAFTLLARELGGDARMHARRILELAAAKVRPCVEELIAHYEMPRDRTVLIGGGGGAAALVPFLAEAMEMPYRIARDAEVISPIGVALALVRDVVERTIVDPTPADIVRLRREVEDRVIAAGAAPDRVEVSIEIDTQRNRVRATASGATALSESAAPASLHIERDGESVRVVDERGVVRLAPPGARVAHTTVAQLDDALETAMESETSFGDVGRSLPSVHVLYAGRIADFSGLASIEQARALAREEVSGRDGGEAVTILTVKRRP